MFLRWGHNFFFFSSSSYDVLYVSVAASLLHSVTLQTHTLTSSLPHTHIHTSDMLVLSFKYFSLPPLATNLHCLWFNSYTSPCICFLLDCNLIFAFSFILAWIALEFGSAPFIKAYVFSSFRQTFPVSLQSRLNPHNVVPPSLHIPAFSFPLGAIKMPLCFWLCHFGTRANELFMTCTN